MEQNEMFLVVKDCLVETLGIDKESVTIDSSLYDDLGAESLDLLDVFFRIEKKINVRISMGDVQKRLQGGLSEEEFFDSNGIVTPLGLDHIKKLLPDKDLAEITGDLDMTNLSSLFTVKHLVEMINEKSLK